MTRIIAQMVVRNEADKYLQSCLEWNRQWWDELHVYDDRSTDDTPNICSKFGYVTERPEDAPSFLEDEGQFRQDAWRHMEETVLPSEDDWVFALDADEFLVGTLNRWDPKDGLRLLINASVELNRESVPIPVPEVWEHVVTPMVRTDGYWAKNKNERLVRYRRGATFREGMGSGSVPESKRKTLNSVYAVSLLHYGYTIDGAAEAKYELYSKNPGRHNPKHIESIVATPELSEWTGEVPKAWLGQR